MNMDTISPTTISRLEYEQLLRIVEMTKKNLQVNSTFDSYDYGKSRRANAELDLVAALEDWEKNIDRLCDR